MTAGSGVKRVGIVGGGIVGLALARHLSDRADVTVLEKEDRVGAHQTSHNSGVAHAGLYYKPGSLKAELCRRGITALQAYCGERGLPYLEVGKLVVARDDSEIAPLAEIERRATANGVPGLKRLGAGGLREIEPHARGVAAVHSPHTAIVYFGAVASAYADDVRKAGGEIRLGFEVAAITGTTVRSRTGEARTFDLLVLCAGLQSDRVSRMAGDTPAPAIVPFRGEYYQLAPNRSGLVNGLIYPVPDPRYPFLGVHLTRRVDGSVEVGPNALLSMSREGYRRGSVTRADLWETLRWPGFKHMARAHWRTGARELYGSLSKRAFVAAARSYLPELTTADVVRGGAGIRAQAVDADGTLLDDFRVNRTGDVVAVRNAPSPAATSSLAIAEHITEHYLGL